MNWKDGVMREKDGARSVDILFDGKCGETFIRLLVR